MELLGLKRGGAPLSEDFKTHLRLDLQWDWGGYLFVLWPQQCIIVFGERSKTDSVIDDDGTVEEKGFMWAGSSIPPWTQPNKISVEWCKARNNKI